jgi:hypothetical protein
MDARQTSEDPSAGTTVVVGIVGAIVFFVIIVALQTLFYKVEQSQTVSKVYETDPQELSRLRADQLEQLHGYRWIDQQQGVVAIPIDVAMEQVVRELADERAEPERSAGDP